MLLASLLILARQVALLARVMRSGHWPLQHPRGPLSSLRTLAIRGGPRAILVAGSIAPGGSW